MNASLLRFKKCSPIAASAQALFDWHETPGALSRLTPPGDPVTLIEHVGGIRDGARVVLRVGRWPFRFRWELTHTDYQPGVSFTDRQVRGPFRSWTHVHRMIPNGDSASILDDQIDYELPLGALGRLLGGRIMHSKLEKLFAHRHAVTQAAFNKSLGH